MIARARAGASWPTSSICRVPPSPLEAVLFDGDETRAAGVIAIAVPGRFPNRPALVAAGANVVAPDLGAALSALGID
jgi:hypothetical protein